jgi:putative YphP/YqiW family bacilliredoxin
MYPEELVRPMEGELTQFGFKALTTSVEVDQEIQKEGTTLVVVNSVCGCAAGSARPAVTHSLTHPKKPANLVTVFAGLIGRQPIVHVCTCSLILLPPLPLPFLRM